VDLPGYGYARGGRESVEEFEHLTQQYFDPSTRQQRWICGVLLLVDSRHPDLRQDAAGYEWLLAVQAPVAIVATKMDKLNRSEQVRTIRALTDKYDSPVLPVSAAKGDGLDEIWKLMRTWNLESKI
jgi:GTP-binding protein